MMIKFLYPDFKTKAFTMSYDDGMIQDVKFVDMLRKYRLKATFNINSGLIGDKYFLNKEDYVVNMCRIEQSDLKSVYDGFEVAVHGVKHLHFEELGKEQLQKEVLGDKSTLEKIFGYEINGLAYPYGTYNENVVNFLNENGFKYARTVKSHKTLNLPQNFLAWHPSCHDYNPEAFDLIDEMKNDNSGELKLLYIWGHSFEFDFISDGNNRWERIEKLCQKAYKCDDFWFATNIEICNYLNALKNVEVSGQVAVNNSDIDIYLTVNDELCVLKPNQEIQI